jgi:hypothetical protein
MPLAIEVGWAQLILDNSNYYYCETKICQMLEITVKRDIVDMVSHASGKFVLDPGLGLAFPNV